MFSYIYMKILEGAPSGYDRLINRISRGHSSRVIELITSKFVEPGMKVLDIGCGTGTLAVSAAEKGAFVTGIDASAEMLSVARAKVESAGLAQQVELIELDASSLDEAFTDGSFDCVVSTLTFSELFRDERTFTLSECNRVLKEKSTLVIADETMPGSVLKRTLYTLMRFPLAIMTFMLTGKGTKAVPNLRQLIEDSGFEVCFFEESHLGAFTVIAARKSKSPLVSAYQTKDVSLVKRMSSPLLEYFFRWFPNPVEPGLRAHGSPDRKSPVLVSSNYSLTEKRLKRDLKDMDCYILLAPTKGINVWCSSCEGEFNARAVASVVKVSRVGEIVDHHRLILPQLSAPGVNKRRVSELTGWDALFGPVFAKDIPAYVSAGCVKKPDMHIYEFKPETRLDLAVSMNFMYFALGMPLVKRYRPESAAMAASLFWLQTFVTYMFFERIPGKYGIAKALVAALAVGTLASIAERFALKGRVRPRETLLFCIGSGLLLGMDLAGITGILKDEPLMLANKLGIKKVGPFTIHEMGHVRLESGKCIGCGSCADVCPRGVFTIDEFLHKSMMTSPDSCVYCRACIMQCPEGALGMH